MVSEDGGLMKAKILDKIETFLLNISWGTPKAAYVSPSVVLDPIKPNMKQLYLIHSGYIQIITNATVKRRCVFLVIIKPTVDYS